MKVRKRIKEYKRYSNTPKAQAQVECGVYRKSIRTKEYKVTMKTATETFTKQLLTMNKEEIKNLKESNDPAWQIILHYTNHKNNKFINKTDTRSLKIRGL